MKIEARAFARGKLDDLFEATGRLDLVARNEEEAQFLAAMLRALSGGGEVEITLKDGRQVTARRDEEGKIHTAKAGGET
jgi:tRNA pseudouridine-54 N-methylase